MGVFDGHGNRHGSIRATAGFLLDVSRHFLTQRARREMGPLRAALKRLWGHSCTVRLSHLEQGDESPWRNGYVGPKGGAV